jgi:hypothetical protein
MQLLLINLILRFRRIMPISWVTWAILTDVRLWVEKQQRKKE